MSFNSVSANTLNVTGVVQASEIRTTMPMQVSNLVVGGNFTSNNLTVLAKSTTVNISSNIFNDLLATTQSGRTALAKALDYGTSHDVFEANGYLPLLDAGYSGKGVLLGHMERHIQFRAPSLRHIINPEHIFTTGNVVSSNLDSFQQIDYANKKISQYNPHQYTTTTMAVGFELHAKISNKRYGKISDANITDLATSDEFVMGAGYNADVVGVDTMSGYDSPIAQYGDAELQAQFPGYKFLFDDIYVETIEKAYLRGCLVLDNEQPMGIFNHPNANIAGTYAMTGVANPISYITSLAADHNAVYCVAGGNWSAITYYNISTPFGGQYVAAGDGVSTDGFLYPMTDSLNILSVGTKLIDDGTLYLADEALNDLVPNTYYMNVSKDYAQSNLWYNSNTHQYTNLPTEFATARNAYGFTTNQLVCFHGFGRTTDHSGPGETRRCKPDIISAQGGANQVIVWPKITQADNTNNYIYGNLKNAATSGTCPTIAGGVCLLREALPRLDAHQIRECIMLSASNGDLSSADSNVGLGYGVINLEAALAYGQARPNSLPPTFANGTFVYSAGFQSNITAGSSNTLSPYQPFVSNVFTPKSVQSFQCPQDVELYGSNVAYTTKYDTYSNLYDTYVASASNLWTAGVLDLSPAKGLWGTSIYRDIVLEGPTFEVVSNKSWISVDAVDMQEIKDLMIANGIKVKTTSTLMGAFSVEAESIEQLFAVIDGNTKIRNIMPVTTCVMSHNGFDNLMMLNESMLPLE